MKKCSDAEDTVEEALHDSAEEEAAATEVQKVLEEMALSRMGPLAQSTAPQVLAQPQVEGPSAAAAPPARQAVAVGVAAPSVPPPPRAQAPPPAAAPAPAAGGYPAAIPTAPPF